MPVHDYGCDRDVIVYLQNTPNASVPSKEYRDVILQGAKDCVLPVEYIEKTI